MFILFDIGGTKMRVALSSDGKTFEQPIITKTPKNFNKGIEKLKKTIDKLRQEKKIKAIVGGIPGNLNQAKTQLSASPNLPLWEKKPFSKKLEQAFNAQVILENDAAVIGLGEACMGAGVDKNIVAYLTIGTGVGGARVVNGKLDETTFGQEPGHQIINFRAPFNCVKCGATGDLESYIGGSSIKRRFGEKVENIKDKSVWQSINRQLAYGIHNTIVFWSPDIIILGGGMMNSENIDLKTINTQLKKTLKILPRLPLIKKAQLGDLGGLHGALHLIKQSQKKKKGLFGNFMLAGF